MEILTRVSSWKTNLCLVSRAPGKRQIKPSAAIFEDGGLAMDDDESDEDFSG